MHGPTSGPSLPNVDALTEREKRTLRLLLDGHDAKSAARALDLSVHTINERLRDARRKLAVSSSKEAARLLRQAESGSQSLGDKPLGDAPLPVSAQVRTPPGTEPWSRRPAVRAIGGPAMLALATLLALTTPVSPPGAPSTQVSDTASPDAAAVVAAARAWLELGDEARWDEAFAATAPSFRAANTPAVWRAVSEKVRAPLGRVLSRTLVTQQEVPTPPRGGWIVRFRTDFANRRDAVETLSLAPGEGGWTVAGIYLE